MRVITGQVVSVIERKIFPGIISVENGRIARIDPLLSVNRMADEAEPSPYFILPGFIDAHVHIESSMLVPSEFARLAVVHGTVGTVSDPHEIANVCGVEGVEFMIADGNSVPFKFNFGAPSCVPATHFETSGAALYARDVDALLQRKDIRYLSEMMNFPGVLQRDEEVMAKIAAAKRLGKPVDGHAPGLRGAQALDYIRAGISTDHECFTKEEAEEKLRYGMKVIIREGSAARDFDALIDLLHDYPESIMFCSDDKHPDSLVKDHINALCRRAVDRGVDIFKVLQAACINPVLHYDLDIGLLREGDAADFIVVEDLKKFKVLQTFIDGELVAEDGRSKIDRGKWKRTNQENEAGLKSPEAVNRFNCTEKKVTDFEVRVKEGSHQEMIPVIEALDGQLITNRLQGLPKVVDGKMVSDVERDFLKIVVVNRYHEAPVASAFIKNFGLKQGAMASSVAHDSHNIVAVGADDECICRAVNLVIAARGGISCVARRDSGRGHLDSGDSRVRVLALPVAGLMSTDDGYQVAEAYTVIDDMARKLGSSLRSPFMTLSFMALLVIPHMKLSDKGLFDADTFRLLDQPA